MPKIDGIRLLTTLLCLVLVLVLLVALGFVLAQVSHALLLFVFAAVLALVVEPLVDWGERHGLPRWLSVVATQLLIGLGCLVGAWLLFDPLARQSVALASALPAYVAGLEVQWMEIAQGFARGPLVGTVESLQTQVLTRLAGGSGELLASLLGALAGLGGNVSDAVLIVIISIYMLLGGRQIHRAVLSVLPPRGRDGYRFTTGALTQVVGGYLRSQLVLVSLLGVAVTVGLGLLGVPYALLLGLVAAALSLIPIFGSALSAVPALLVALTQPFPTVVWVLILFIVAQNVKDQVLAPRLQSQALGLHPLAVIFAVLAGAQMGGWIGAIFAVPVAAFLWIVVVALYRNVAPQTTSESSAVPQVTTGHPAIPSGEVTI